MNPFQPQDRPQGLPTRRSFVRRLRTYPRRALRLHLLSLSGLILLASLIAFALSDLQVEAGSAGARQHNDVPPASPSLDAAKTPLYRNTAADVKYVGSEACKNCHQLEYEHYFKTPHGQAAALAGDRSELKDLPSNGITVCPDNSGHCFRVFPRKDGSDKDGSDKGGYFMSQFDRGADGTESNVEVERIAFALSKPLMATGYVIQRGNYLFEAPLTFYAVPGLEHVRGWAISPGYTNDSRAFNRPLTDACLTCHFGRPRAMDKGVNLYKSPPFEELAIGCESCHGPGGLHVRERQNRVPGGAGPDTSIVNPKFLSGQLADDTCIYCHELGEARVLQPGKSWQDYRPGVPLLHTAAIFKSKLLLGWNVEEWSDEMATSKCYRFSKGAMRCSTCHDPHSTPTAQEAPEFYRAKCLNCHQSASCSLPLSARQHTQPVDNCITCHMPKHAAPKMVKFGGQGTSHRITKTDDEALPPADNPRTEISPVTGLILTDNDAGSEGTSSDAGEAQNHLDPVVLMKGYQGIEARNHSKDLPAQYDALLRQMANYKDDAFVFSALANSEVAKHTDDGDRIAIHDLLEAVRLESDTPKDYMLLSELQFRANDFDGAIAVLTLAIQRFPYTPAAYEHLAACYQSAGQPSKAAETIRRGLEVFPSDKGLLLLAQQTHP